MRFHKIFFLSFFFLYYFPLFICHADSNTFFPFSPSLFLSHTANLSDLPKKKSTTASTHSSLPPSPSPTSGPADVLMGMHLYRCFQCKQTLLRPLVCGRCMGAAYCSKVYLHPHYFSLSPPSSLTLLTTPAYSLLFFFCVEMSTATFGSTQD